VGFFLFFCIGGRKKSGGGGVLGGGGGGGGGGGVIKGCKIFFDQNLAITFSFVGGRIIVQQENVSRV
jgi:hypothetical protein